jgi:capsular polysaccharide biosynthesis protein
VELRAYARILGRRWPALVALPALVLLLALVQEAARDPRYATSLRATVIYPELSGAFTDYPVDDNYLASEFAIDDLVEAVRGNVFSEAVAQRLQAAGVDIGGGEVQGAVAADRRHRVLSVTVTASDPGRAEAIARAVADELEQNTFAYTGLVAQDSESTVRIIQRPGAAGDDTGRARLLLVLQVAAAVGAGVLLALLVDYLDDTLYDGESAAAATGLAHLASVPAGSMEQRA